MDKIFKVLLKIAGIISLVVGVICCFSIVLLLIGVPLVIGSVKLLNFAELEDDELVLHKKEILAWGILFLFLSFISGILTLIVYFQINKYLENKKEQPKVINSNKNNKDNIKKDPKKEEKTTNKKTSNNSVKTTNKKTTNKTGKATNKKTSNKLVKTTNKKPNSKKK